MDMQQPNHSPSAVTGGPSAASELNKSSSDTESDHRFEENLATLTEMFPACDIATLRNYLESFSDNPNCMTIIVSMLLEGDCSSGVNLEENSTREQSELKRKADTAAVEGSLHKEDQVQTPSPSKFKRGDICRNKAKCSSSLVVLRGEEVNSKADILPVGSATRETASPSRSHTIKKEEPRLSKHKRNRSENGSLRSPEHFASETTSNVDKEEDIVFVKSVTSSPKQSFYRTEQSKAGTTSPKQHKQRNGICIRYKGGNFHPSMKKPKKLQIVKLNADRENTRHCDQSALNGMPQISTDLRYRSSNTCSKKVATATNSKSNNYSPLQPCKGTGCSASKEKATENPPAESAQQYPVSTECEQMEELTHSNNASSEGASPVAAALSDLEILKKVFPDADPTYISSLLDKYTDEPNRVALVGKELGSSPVPPHGKSMKKKAIPPVTWFWESESGKLVPFTDSECNALEKQFNSHDTQGQSSHAGRKAIRLPGSTKHFTVNFGQMEMVCESGQKTPIIRVPGGSDERKEIGGKSLIPQEALSVPSDWQQQTGSAELISVRPGSAEWDHVQGSLKRSLKAARVVDIQRVQNKWLYRKYAIQRHLLKDKNGPTSINEKELFHGTRLTNPDSIWMGEDGFDMRYSANGMWGRGTYFASEAVYCHQGFVFRDTKTQNFQLFLAHVLTGDSVFLHPDASIKMPPLKGASNIRYDSVNGVTKGCTVYILYKLDMAYPAYLITYTLSH